MPRKKAKDALVHLGAGECAQVLRELLKRHRDLRGEANEIAESLIDDITVDAVAEDVAQFVGSIGIEDLSGRAGKQSWGYVEPSEAAWELLEESIEDFRADMKRRFEAGMKPAAEKICQGASCSGWTRWMAATATARSAGHLTSRLRPLPGVCRFSSSCIHSVGDRQPAIASSRLLRSRPGTGSRC